MKKFIFIFLILVGCTFAQRTYYFNDTASTVPKRITQLVNGYSNTTFLTGKTNYTIMGYATGDVIFSFGDSLFTTSKSHTTPSGKAVFEYNIPVSQYPNCWFKSSTGTISVYFETRVY